MNETTKRGFAAMSAERQRQIASLGGRSVPAKKRSFRAKPDLACSAGRKGGLALRPEKRSFSLDPALARKAGAMGGQACPSRKRAFAQDRELARRASLLGLQARQLRRLTGVETVADEPLIADTPT